MTKKRIAMFFMVLLLFSFCAYAQTQNETRNLRVTYDVVDESTGLLVRSSTLIVTVSGPITYDSIIEAAAKALGFYTSKESSNPYTRQITSEGRSIRHRLIIKDYTIIE